ncbi:MAG: hypothetical protein J6K89_03605 [Oscillospiraceae bacterium]|nr:hypothetical protein [Oscillospiraceae bacterium]
MNITSYNDLAYSIEMEGNEYVLPEAWLHTLQGALCTPQMTVADGNRTADLHPAMGCRSVLFFYNTVS